MVLLVSGISNHIIFGISQVFEVSGSVYQFDVATWYFAWEDQRAKVYFIFHKALLRCEECFI